MLSISSSSYDSVFVDTEVNNLFDPKWFYTIYCAILTGDGLIGLLCGAFILFMT